MLAKTTCVTHALIKLIQVEHALGLKSIGHTGCKHHLLLSVDKQHRPAVEQAWKSGDELEMLIYEAKEHVCQPQSQNRTHREQ